MLVCSCFFRTQMHFDALFDGRIGVVPAEFVATMTAVSIGKFVLCDGSVFLGIAITDLDVLLFHQVDKIVKIRCL